LFLGATTSVAVMRVKTRLPGWTPVLAFGLVTIYLVMKPKVSYDIPIQFLTAALMVSVVTSENAAKRTLHPPSHVVDGKTIPRLSFPVAALSYVAQLLPC
jgi:Na+-translocating ferredoxin:NAD+ oxidoreductase RnfD subunit